MPACMHLNSFHRRAAKEDAMLLGGPCHSRSLFVSHLLALLHHLWLWEENWLQSRSISETSPAWATNQLQKSASFARFCTCHDRILKCPSDCCTARPHVWLICSSFRTARSVTSGQCWITSCSTAATCKQARKQKSKMLAEHHQNALVSRSTA